MTGAPGAPGPRVPVAGLRGRARGPRVSFILGTKNERPPPGKEASSRVLTTTWRNKDVSSPAENRCVREKTHVRFWV